jgi:hypothetical protein
MLNKYWLSLALALTLIVSTSVLWVSQNTKIAQPGSLSCLYPQHVFVGATAYAWCEGPSSIGVAQVSPLTKNLMPVYGIAGRVRLSSKRVDGSRCPEHKTCFRFLYKGLHPTPKSHGDTVVVRLFGGNGMDYGFVGYIPVVKDQF